MSICDQIGNHILHAKTLLGNKHDIDCAVAVVRDLCKICNHNRENNLCKAISAARTDSSPTFQATGSPTFQAATGPINHAKVKIS